MNNNKEDQVRKTRRGKRGGKKIRENREKHFRIHGRFGRGRGNGGRGRGNGGRFSTGRGRRIVKSHGVRQKHEQLHEMKGLSSDENVEKQYARQKEQIMSLQSQVAEQKHELNSLKKNRDCIMSVSLLEEETKCSLCYNKFSTDLNSTLPEIRKFLLVLSRAACPHYFCQGCVEKSQLAAAEIAPRNRVPKWLKCMVCKQKTAFCPEDPFYHTKLIQLLDRARRFHPINVKVEEGHNAAETHSNSNDNRRESKHAKVANVAIKEES